MQYSIFEEANIYYFMYAEFEMMATEANPSRKVIRMLE